MADFSNQPTMKGFFSPQRYDADVLDCEVIGTIPQDLSGAFVRLGGDWYYPPKFPDDAPLHSDGYISMFRFQRGRVAYKGRFVRTERFRNNLAAGRQLYGYYRNASTDDPSVRDITHPARRTVSNTTPLAFAGQLFSLKEDGLPYRIDPLTLETLGTYDYGGRWKSQTHTAHPKIDPVSGEMVAFGYEATGPASRDVFVYTVDRKGRITREARFQLPYASMIHDIALTQKHIVFPFACYVTSPEILAAGKIHWWWDRSKPSMVGILPRDGDGRDVRWFRGPERCMMHTVNARTEGDRVILEAPFWDSNFFPFFPNLDGSPWDPSRARAFMRRYTFDLNSKDDRWSEETLFQTPVVDLARIDPRWLTLDQRYAYTGYSDPGRPFDEKRAGNLQGRVTNSYGRFDLKSGKLDSYFAGDVHSLQECCFVPRPGGTAEGDGWLIGVASNYAEMRSELIIADAGRLGQGDVARVILPFRAGPQVHGTWVQEGELPLPTTT
jgi:carotenoid cleavage dioxygenase